VTFARSRLPQCAVLVLAFFSLKASVAQSSANFPASDSGANLSYSLPDAPSFSSSQEAQAPAQTGGPPGETEEQRQRRLQHEEAEREVAAQKKQRVGGVMPEFNVVMNGKAVPLTPKQKFDLSWHTIIDPYTIGLAIVFGGGLGELEDSHTGYGHGPGGLAERIGASYLDNIDGNLIGNFLLPVLLHQDPRYFRKGTGSIKSRIVYSAMTTFICHSDKGKHQFNTSNVLGNFISGAISNAYYPSDERGVGLTLENGVFVTFEGMLGAQILEFSPDVTAALHRRSERKRAAKAAKAAGANPAAPATPAPPPPEL
jgi:hypothetical protein